MDSKTPSTPGTPALSLRAGDIELGNEVGFNEGKTAELEGSTAAQVTAPAPRPSGFLNFLLLLPERDDPRTYSLHQKSLILFVIAITAMAIPLSSSILFPAFRQIEQEFNTTPTVTSLTVSLFYAPTLFTSSWWMELVQMFGRRKIMLFGVLLNLVACLSCALAVNIEMLLIFRLFCGAGCSSASVIATQIVYDCFEMRERGRAIGWLVVPPLLAPLLAPIVGGALTASLGWRSSLWFLVIMCAICLVLVTMFVPETCRWTTDNTRPYQNDSWHKTWLKIIVSPVVTFRYLRYPPVLIASIWGFFPYTVQYILNISIETAYSNPPYGYSALIVGALYAPSAAGYMIGSAVGGHWSDATMIKSANKRRVEAEANGIPEPLDKDGSPYRVEDRVGLNATFGLVTFIAAMIWYGWTAQFYTHIATQLVALFIFGWGCSQLFILFNVVLSDSMPENSGELFAMITGLRGGFVAIGSVITPPLLGSIGNGWTFTMLAFLSIALIPMLIVYRQKAMKWNQQLRSGHYNF